jgi:hypothetical protein
VVSGEWNACGMTALAVVTLLIWIYLVFAHGRFWQAGPVLPKRYPRTTPSLAVVVPARDEAASIEASLRSLLAQDYAGPFRVILTDDESTDGTGDIARAIGDPRLTVLTGAPHPPGWSGKLWAVGQGVAEAGTADLVLLTDADIVHDAAHVSALVAHAERYRVDLVSEMVRLRCEALLRIGGIQSIRAALIDDVALAAAVKTGGPIWLGHSDLARSVREYPAVGDIWRMITRTAYVQLRYSPLLLFAATAAMAVTWLAPPALVLVGHGAAFWCGLAAWLVLSASYLPTLRRFGRALFWAPILPVVAGFYMAATIGSAGNHYFGRGVAWKGRAYQGTTG